MTDRNLAAALAAAHDTYTKAALVAEEAAEASRAAEAAAAAAPAGEREALRNAAAEAWAAYFRAFKVADAAGDALDTLSTPDARAALDAIEAKAHPTTFIVMVSKAKMPSKCWGRYVRVAVVEVEGDTSPKMISNRARGVVRVVETWEKRNDAGPKSAGAVARAEAVELAKRLNAEREA